MIFCVTGLCLGASDFIFNPLGQVDLKTRLDYDVQYDNQSPSKKNR